MGTVGLVLAIGASAHVTVAAPGVELGANDAQIVFRFPDESATASTVGLKVQLPLDHPIAGVLVAPTLGWTASGHGNHPAHTTIGDFALHGRLGSGPDGCSAFLLVVTSRGGGRRHLEIHPHPGH